MFNRCLLKVKHAHTSWELNTKQWTKSVSNCGNEKERFLTKQLTSWSVTWGLAGGRTDRLSYLRCWLLVSRLQSQHVTQIWAKCDQGKQWQCFKALCLTCSLIYDKTSTWCNHFWLLDNVNKRRHTSGGYYWVSQAANYRTVFQSWTQTCRALYQRDINGK